MNLALALQLLSAVPAAVAAASSFKDVFHEIVDLIDGKDDQATAKEAYQDLIADNAEGFARLDAKLAAAALKS